MANNNALNRQRLDKRISQALNISRKDVKRLLAKQEISVDGVTTQNADEIVNKFSKIIVTTQLLPFEEAYYLMLNKPKGVVSATKDNKHQTVINLLNFPYKNELHIVGRLDLNSTGLILLTNDSRWSEQITNPSAKVEKQYLVTVDKPITQDYATAFAQGMYFEYENATTLPAQLEILTSYKALVIIQEGKYHQIKRMFGRFQNKVLSIHRISVGHITLDKNLKAGDSRSLSVEEINNNYKNNNFAGKF
ncbi:pseudouridine synthase [Thalassotalea hakodatensis]|uniref:pseudouridine synthase n=1 Tax=Thalassotalea hakodatensis TaxID=3030492 RepID=UPI00257229C8|nr:pseudouridine synthase [Thalassotalea hakodatensis]